MTPSRKRLLFLGIGGLFILAILVVIFGLWHPWSRPARQETAREPGEAAERGERREKHEEKHEERGERQVKLSEEAMKGIKLAKAERRRLARELSFTGEVAFHPDRVAIIGPKMSARVVRVSAGVGDKVTRGQVLATLESAEFARARGTYIAALARRDAALMAFDRQQRLRAEGINSIRDVEEARAKRLTTRAELEAARGTLAALGIAAPGEGDSTSSALRLSSPIAGSVVKREAIVGQTVEATASLFTVADLSTVWVLLDVYERDLGRVAPGAEAVITTSAYPGRTFTGRVAYVSEILEERTRTAKVRVVISNEDRALRPGMFCRATLRSKAAIPAGGKGDEGPGEDREQTAAREALLVPAAALQRLSNGDAVFVHTGERAFRARPVRIGERTDRFVEVRGGLREGEEVATEGSLTLKAELERTSLGDGDGD